MNSWDRVSTLYESGRVKRLHTVPTVDTHTIASHVYGSMVFAMEICEIMKLNPTNVLRALLYHDAPELATGDLPAPVKREDPAVNERLNVMEARFYKTHGIDPGELSLEERDVVKACDTLDLAFCCLHERRMGNRTQRINHVFGNCLSYLQAQAHLLPVKTLIERLMEEWHYAGVL